MRMNHHVFLLCAVVVIMGLDSSRVTAAPFDFKDLIPDIIDRIAESKSTTFLGLTCSYSVIPTFRDWELHFKAKFWCPELVPAITGNAIGKSSQGTVAKATRDFARKALERKIFTADQLKHWL